MIRLLLLLALSAPFQCASDPNPQRRLEDSPSEALWHLAERLELAGEHAAARMAFEEILERYPRSVEAERVRLHFAEEGSEEPSQAAPGSP